MIALIRRAGLAAALCLCAPAAAQADPAFLGFALSPTQIAAEPVETGLGDFTLKTENAALISLAPDFSLIPMIETPPLRTENAFLDRPSRPGLSARRLSFEEPAQPQIEFKRPFSPAESVTR